MFGEHRVFFDVDGDARRVILRAVRLKQRKATKEIA
jgi:hypothetical protein